MAVTAVGLSLSEVRETRMAKLHCDDFPGGTFAAQVAGSAHLYGGVRGIVFNMYLVTKPFVQERLGKIIKGQIRSRCLS